MQCSLFVFSLFLLCLSLTNQGVRSDDDDDEDENGGGKDSELMAKLRAFFSEDPLETCLDYPLKPCRACDPSCRNLCKCKTGKTCKCTSAVGAGTGKLCVCKDP